MFPDSRTGVITTRVKLNRELKSNYSFILIIRDGGAIPQQATKIFEIRVNDTDDNLPLFKRAVVSTLMNQINLMQYLIATVIPLRIK